MLQNPAYVAGEAARGHAVESYAYAGNNPLLYADPTGLYKTTIACPGIATPIPWTNHKDNLFPTCEDCIEITRQANEYCGNSANPTIGCSCAQHMAQTVCGAAFNTSCRPVPAEPIPQPKQPDEVACR